MARRSTIARELEQTYKSSYEHFFLNGGQEPTSRWMSFGLSYDELSDAKLYIRRTAWRDAMKERRKLAEKIQEEGTEVPSPELSEDAVDPGMIS